MDACGQPSLDPVLPYSRTNGLAIIGGFVYRGRASPELMARCVLGDCWYFAGEVNSPGGQAMLRE